MPSVAAPGTTRAAKTRRSRTRTKPASWVSPAAVPAPRVPVSSAGLLVLRVVLGFLAGRVVQLAFGLADLLLRRALHAVDSALGFKALVTAHRASGLLHAALQVLSLALHL